MTLGHELPAPPPPERTAPTGGHPRDHLAELDVAVAELAAAARVAAPDQERAAFDALAEAHYARGLAWMALGDWPRAEADLRQAVRFVPGHAPASYAAALLRLRLDDPTGALAGLDRLLAGNPDCVPARHARGCLRREQGLLGLARDDLDHALSLQPADAELYASRAALHRLAGDLDAALVDCATALRLQPRSAHAWLQQGLVRAQRGDRATALADLQQAAQRFLARGANDAFVLATDAIQALRALPESAPAETTEPAEPVQTAPQVPPPLPPQPPLGVGRDEVRVFLDTSSLMFEAAPAFFEGWVVPLAAQPGVRFVVTGQTLVELDKHLHSTNAAKRQRAESARALLERYRRGPAILEVFGDANDPFVDNLIQARVTEFCLRYACCVVTQDWALAEDVLHIGQRKSVRRTKPISVVRIGRDGAAQDFAHLLARRDARAQRQPAPRPLSHVFRLVSGTVTPDATPLAALGPLAEGTTVVTAQGRPVQLQRALKRGGEGTIYLTDSGLVCKVYTERPPTVAMRQKLELMTAHPVHYRGICWPRELVFAEPGGAFVGYLMPRVPDGVHDVADIASRAKIKRAFPTWDRRNLVIFATTLLQAIAHLHRCNVLLGDISLANFMVQDERTIFLVDTDSYQVEGFPSPVTTLPFTHPDLLGKDCRTVLRTLVHEEFALATLLFMVLVPGQSPYARQGGSSLVENLKAALFPYPMPGKRGAGAPDYARYIWSWLPLRVRQCFAGVFAERRTISARGWLEVLTAYRAELDTATDAQAAGGPTAPALAIFPAGYKPGPKRQPGPGETLQTCQAPGCGYVFVEPAEPEPDEPKLCKHCRIKRLELPCARAGCRNTTQVKLAQTLKAPHRRWYCAACREARQFQRRA